jgi:hypothetical protein
MGTAFEQVAEHRQQVELKAGELVAILGQKSIGAKDGNQTTWLKIAPPAGEFRWIHLRDVSRQKPEERPQVEPIAASIEDLNEKEPEEPWRITVSGNAIAIRPLDAGSMFDRNVQPAQFKSGVPAESPQPLSTDGFVPRKRRPGEPPSSTVRRTSPTPISSNPISPRLASVPARQDNSSIASIATPISRGIGSDDIGRQLEQIEVDLSLMLAQDRSQWNLAALRQRVDRLIETGADPAARGRARLTLDKIKQFENAFDASSNAPISSSTAGQASSGTFANPHSSVNLQSSANTLADPRYDAQGWLKPVISKKSDKPVAPYAVVDKDGQPICFVSPSPGLNLNRYLNKEVGLYGRRGYLAELKKPHVMAERVIEMDRHLR